MQELLLELNKIIEKARVTIADYQTKLTNVSEKEKKIVLREIDVKNKEKELNKREQDIIPSEQVLAMKKDLEVKEIRNAEFRDLLSRQRNEFEDFKKSEIQKISDSKLINIRESENNEKQRQLLIKKEKDIENEIARRVSDFLTRVKAG